MTRGVLDLVGLAATLVFALPVALFGLGRLAAGDTLGGGVFLGVAVGMVLVDRYVLGPADLLVGTLQQLTGLVVRAPPEDGEDDPESDG